MIMTHKKETDGDNDLVDTDVASSLLPDMIRNSIIWEAISLSNEEALIDSPDSDEL